MLPGGSSRGEKTCPCSLDIPMAKTATKTTELIITIRLNILLKKCKKKIVAKKTE